jgi:hypothetical protein
MDFAFCVWDALPTNSCPCRAKELWTLSAKVATSHGATEANAQLARLQAALLAPIGWTTPETATAAPIVHRRNIKYRRAHRHRIRIVKIAVPHGAKTLHALLALLRVARL